MTLTGSRVLPGRFALSPFLPVQPLARQLRRLLVGTGLVVVLARTAIAQQPPPANDLEEIVVRETQRNRVGIDESALSKLPLRLRDTPQSVTTLSSDLLNERGMMSLDDALRSVSGITLGAGEFSWQGNNPSIRGFGARDDMYLDGVRDFGSYARDPFNLESIEVLLGPSSILFGRGSTGGAINQVSKRPSLSALTDLSLNAGSDGTMRGTLDLARPVPLIGDGAALRLNVLAHHGEVADRDQALTRRFGFAPTLALGLGSDTQLTLSYMKQTADDRPDYGLPWIGSAPAPVRRSHFYGFESDYLETDADIATVELRHAISDLIRVDARARYADYARSSRITEPLVLGPATAPLDAISVFRYVFIGESDETLAAAQLNLTLELGTGRLRHTLVTGTELGRETSEPQFAFGIGAPSTRLVEPTPSDPFTATNTDPRVQADTMGDTYAIYLIDTISLGDSWQITLGARRDRFDTDYDATRFTGPPTPFNAGDVAGSESFDQRDEVTSYRTAVVYKPADIMSLYLAGSTSFNPSAQSLSLLSTGRGLGVSNALLDPEENTSVELGFKADLRAETLSLTAALFETTKSNARVPDPANPGFNTLGGKQRVRGLSLDASGMVTDRLFLTAGYTYLDSEVVAAGPGAVTGARLANAPEHSATVWFDYQITDRFDIGAGARYVDETLAQNTGAGRLVPSYTLIDAMGRYRVSESLTVKLNLTNLTDELYFGQLHPWHVVPGPGFTATAAVNMVF